MEVVEVERAKLSREIDLLFTEKVKSRHLFSRTDDEQRDTSAMSKEQDDT